MTKHDNVGQEGIMKASEFVKKFGWDLVIEHLENAPESATVISGLTCQFFKQDDNSPVWSKVYYSNGKECSLTRFSPIVSPIEIEDLKRIVESHKLIKRMDFWERIDKGLMKAKMVIENNTLQASYFQPNSGNYYRYGHGSIYVVMDDEWKEVYGGMDSKSLIHIDRLKQAIADVESCQ